MQLMRTKNQFLVGVALSPLVAALLLLGGGGTAHAEVPIYDIQGAGHISPFVGQNVTTTGVVTAIAFNGYYVQDPIGDGNDDTSDGMFVFQFGSIPSVGDLL